MNMNFSVAARIVCLLAITSTVVAEPIPQQEMKEITASYKRW